ncbi:MAG TPA: LysE family transporter [Desulfopila sp.]|nr:LysE family transporter [Desulfopila sp.]
MTEHYLGQFVTIMVVHLLAVASPGPDFAVVVKQSITHGRATALWTSLGVGTGIFLHVLYSLLGIGVIISQSLLAFTVMKFLGAAYLIFIGWKAIRTRPAGTGLYSPSGISSPSALRAYWTGFLTNGLNPKATLFFLSLFTVVIAADTPVAVQAAYGVYMAFATALWFSIISLLFGSSRVRRLFARIGHWFERMMGVALLGLGVKLLVTTHK